MTIEPAAQRLMVETVFRERLEAACRQLAAELVRRDGGSTAAISAIFSRIHGVTALGRAGEALSRAEPDIDWKQGAEDGRKLASEAFVTISQSLDGKKR